MALRRPTDVHRPFTLKKGALVIEGFTLAGSI